LALACLIICRADKLSSDVTAIAASPFLYAGGYLIFGVATGMRYYVWTITGTALASVLVAAELSRRREQPNRRGMALAAAAIIIPTMMATLARAGL